MARAIARWLGRSSYIGSVRATGPRGPSRSSTSSGAISTVSRSRGTSTTTYSAFASLSMIPKPIPPSCMRAATSRSASDGSSVPDGWLWSSISPRSAAPGSARTLRTSPRETTRAVWTTPSSSRVATKHTSFPPASAIAVRIARAAGELMRDAGSGKREAESPGGATALPRSHRCTLDSRFPRPASRLTSSTASSSPRGTARC